MGPDGTVGCDVVPTPIQFGDEPPIEVPPGSNQTVVSTTEPASFRFSATPTFTRDVDALPPGHRLVNGATACAVGWQGTVNCDAGEHGFIYGGMYGYNW